jgi:tetratricopeptide (TPR) repeat protein
LLAHLNSFWGSFQFDDYKVIVDNPVVHSWSSWLADIKHGIRPFLKFTYTLNWTSGLGVFGFHAFNITVHMLNTLLVYLLSCRFLAGQAESQPEMIKYTAFTAALLFGLHPVQTEAVTYISSRSTSLMFLLYLSSFFTYLHGRSASRPFFLYLLSPALFFLALATKEIAVTLPAALLLWEATCGDRPLSLSSALKAQAVHWALAGCALIALFLHPRYGELLLYSLDLRSVQHNLLSQIHGVSHLLSRFLLMHRLSIDPDLPVLTVWSPLLACEALMLGSVALTGALLIRRKPVVTFCIFWFILHLLPTSSLIPRIDIANERQLYCGSWGLFLLAGTGFVRLCGLRQRDMRPLWRGLALAALVLAAFTTMRNRAYRSEISLWEDTARTTPGKARVFNNLGYAYYLSGRYGEAAKAYKRALQLKPDYALARNNLSTVEHGKPGESVKKGSLPQGAGCLEYKK